MTSAVILDRRRELFAGRMVAAIGLAATKWPRALASIRTGGGVAGGGKVQLDRGEAQFSVFGSTFHDDMTEEPVTFGSFIWLDPTGFALRSDEIVAYGPDPDQQTARIMTGYVAHSDTGKFHPFQLRLIDGGGPGEGLDLLELLVGKASGKRKSVPDISERDAEFQVEGVITAGDIQLLTFDFAAD
jgi:hypothetical protein